MPGIREIIMVVFIIWGISDGMGGKAIFLHSTKERTFARLEKGTTTPVRAVELVNAGSKCRIWCTVHIAHTGYG